MWKIFRNIKKIFVKKIFMIMIERNTLIIIFNTTFIIIVKH